MTLSLLNLIGYAIILFVTSFIVFVLYKFFKHCEDYTEEVVDTQEYDFRHTNGDVDRIKRVITKKTYKQTGKQLLGFEDYKMN